MQIDAKTFFRGCRRLDKRIDGKCDEIEHVRLMAERVTASYSDEPRGAAAQRAVWQTRLPGMWTWSASSSARWIGSPNIGGTHKR